MTILAEMARLEAHNAVLRALVSHPNLLERRAFDDLRHALLSIVGFRRMAILIPEGDGQLRVHAIDEVHGTDAPLPFGARIPGSPSVSMSVFGAQTHWICDDTRLGSELDRAAAQTGVLSYVALPMRKGDAGRDRRTVAELALGFAEVGGARRAPIALLQEVADLIGAALDRSLRLARDKRFSLILKTSSDAMVAWDREGRITDANAAASMLSGRPRHKLIGMPIIELLGPLPDGRGPLELVQAARGTAEVTEKILPLEGVRLDLFSQVSPSAGGGLRRIVVAATITAVDDDALVSAHALLRDLTQVVSAEEEAAANLRRVRELEEQHRTLLDNAPLIIFRLDPRTEELVYLNRHAERLLGVPRAEALATRGFLRTAHADQEGVASFDRAVAEARTLQATSAPGSGPHSGPSAPPYEARLLRRGEDAIVARGTVYPLLSERGELVAIEGVLLDVSGEHAARSRLIQNDRLATLGTLAASVAHEINNPAAFILLGLDMLGRMLGGQGVTMAPAVSRNATETLRELRESIRRIVDIAKDLRLFASPPPADEHHRPLCDVNRTVESALSLTRSQLLERAQIVRRLGTDLPPVRMDDGRLAQVVVNLLVNAAQAIPRSPAREQAVTIATRANGQQVEIEIRDTGSGIPREIQARIWQPFFTTKSAELGTGLGLAISKELIERAGGTIEVESPVADPEGPPRGTRFVISLPAAIDVSEPSQEPPPPRASTQVRARVLIVEDEPSLARALAEEIARTHEVAVAGSAGLALSLLAERRFDVVLCDLRMPGMSGETFYAKVAEKDEAQARAFVFMTGVGFGADVERFLARAGRPVLEKPFPADAALAAIADIVSSRA
ncbi:MAG: ATP-binding protein [Byssovorax sp.]